MVEANIRSVGDGLWWAVSTVTAVGYGDKYPTTGAGRLLAAGLLGIGLFGILTASLSSFFVAESRQSVVARVEAELALLRTEVTELVRQLDAGGFLIPASSPGRECPNCGRADGGRKPSIGAARRRSLRVQRPRFVSGATVSGGGE